MANLSVAQRSQILPPHGGRGQGNEVSEDTDTRVTPLAPPPQWLSRMRLGIESPAVPSAEPVLSDQPIEAEEQFWQGPRYSLNPPSLLPPASALAQAPSRARKWSAWLLFGAIMCAVLGLLLLETHGVVQGAKDPAAAFATGSLPASAPR